MTYNRVGLPVNTAVAASMAETWQEEAARLRTAIDAGDYDIQDITWFLERMIHAERVPRESDLTRRDVKSDE
jgi:hypothetical protein